MYGASFGNSMHRRHFHDANLKTGRPGRARVAAAAGTDARGADAGRARRHLRRADGGGRARISGSQRPRAGRHRGRADAPRTAAVLHRLRHAHHPRGRHVFRPRAAVRHERGRHRARQSLPRPGAAAARPGADDPAAVFRHAGGHSLFLGAHRIYRARAGRALSHARRRGVRPQRARPAAVVSDARQRAEARVLQRRAPRQRVDHDAAAAHVLRAAVRPPRRRGRPRGPKHPRPADKGHARARPGRGPGRHRPRDRRARCRKYRRGADARGQLPRHSVPRGLEGEHPRHRPQPPVPRGVEHRARDQIRRGLHAPRPARLCRPRAAGRARESGDVRLHPRARPAAHPVVPHAGPRHLLAVRRL